MTPHKLGDWVGGAPDMLSKPPIDFVEWRSKEYNTMTYDIEFGMTPTVDPQLAYQSMFAAIGVYDRWFRSVV